MVDNSDEVRDMLAFLRQNMPVMEQSWRLLNEELKEIKDLAKQNNRALRGTNGEAGLVSDVTSLCTSYRELKTEVREISNLLHKGDSSEPGLVEQVRDMVRWRGSVKYWAALLIGATLVNIIAVIIQLASRSIIPGG